MVLSMMLMPAAPAPGSMKPVNGFASVGAPGGNLPHDGIEWDSAGMKKSVPGAHFNRQRAPIQTTLQRLNLQCYAIVVDAITAVNARAPIFALRN